MRVIHFGTALACALCLSSFVAAAEKDGKAVESKPSKPAAKAAAVDLVGELGIALDSLRTLGVRVDEARVKRDPVILACLARELAAAESVAGKKGSIKSEDLATEAAEMARLRYRAIEMKAVAKLLEGDVAKDLAVAAEKAEAADKNRKPEDVASKGIQRTLFVENTTKYYIDVFVNSRNVGTVSPYHTGRLYVGDLPWATTKLEAEAPGLSYTWGPRYVATPTDDFTWTLQY